MVAPVPARSDLSVGRHSRSPVSVAALVFVTLMACASTASANADGSGVFDPFDPAQISPAVWLGSSAILFGGTDLVFGLLGRPLPPGLAVVQLVVAGLAVPLLTLANSDSAVLSIAAVASMAWFTSHAIYCAAVYPEYQRRKRREQRQRAIAYGVALSPGAPGILLRLFGPL